MTAERSEDAIRRAVTVQVSAERAFGAFTERLATWWPKEYTWSGEVLETIGIEPREGGRCFERGPYGFECQWGRVLAWQPPSRLVLAWQIGPARVPEPDPAKASQVEVCFLAEGPRTTWVELEHRSFARHGEGADAYRVGMASAQGWPYLMDRYAAAVA